MAEEICSGVYTLEIERLEDDDANYSIVRVTATGTREEIARVNWLNINGVRMAFDGTVELGQEMRVDVSQKADDSIIAAGAYISLVDGTVGAISSVRDVPK